MQNAEFENARIALREMCRRLGLHEQQVQATLIRRWLHEVRNQVILGSALRISIIKQEATMPRRPSKPTPPTAPAAENAAAEMADPLAALPAADPLAVAEADPLGAVAPAVNTSSGPSLDSLAQGVDQASIAKALGAVGSQPSVSGPDPVVAQALIDLKTLVSGLTNRFDLIESKIAAVETKLVDGQIAMGKTLKGFYEEWKTGQVAVLDAIKDLLIEDDSVPEHVAPAQPTGTITKLAPAPAAPGNRHAEILAVLVPALQGRPNFNYKANPAVPQALAAAAAQKGVTCTGEEALAALASVGRVKDDGTIVNQ